MLNKEKIKEFDDLKKYLINNNLTFIDENESRASPSAAADEIDID